MPFEHQGVKKAKRWGREKGRHFYIPWEELEAAGLTDPEAGVYFRHYGVRPRKGKRPPDLKGFDKRPFDPKAMGRIIIRLVRRP